MSIETGREMRMGKTYIIMFETTQILKEDYLLCLSILKK